MRSLNWWDAIRGGGWQLVGRGSTEMKRVWSLAAKLALVGCDEGGGWQLGGRCNTEMKKIESWKHSLNWWDAMRGAADNLAADAALR